MRNLFYFTVKPGFCKCFLRKILDKYSTDSYNYHYIGRINDKRREKSMLITRECDYGVRIVRALAKGEKMCVNQVCEQEGLTPAFVYKILKKLEKKDIVKSFRGSNGGYALKRSIEELTLLDIYLAVEPDFYMIECMNPQKPCTRNQSDCGCAVHRELARVQQILLTELKAHSIAEIIGLEKEE